ncbi:MAG: DUF72 domain-containing protein [Pyrinomonadaceae bacterium]|nr:DUF72 domain-containing protein [Pyrinomonadaceae bacterium]MCX7640376.1 DUF72 domain-containing protein [Pyrinomonadaceae bacterium]MDW8304804.1 DUF72 domain-containing protein [Acidobacteriota bacterium]
MKQVFIGCQGWNYKDWISTSETIFYPRNTNSSQMLSIYSEAFDCVEVDSTFYAIPSEMTIEGWYRKTPDNFKFALKLPRQITHENLLSEASYGILDEFCEKISALKNKLLAVLIQLPPQFEADQRNTTRLRRFLSRLPKDVKFAIEFRRREWLVDSIFEELEKTNTTLCLVEGEWIARDVMFQAIERLIDEFSYIRFMGRRDLVEFKRVVRPQDENLKIWKENLDRLKANKIFVSFSNFYEGFAPESANKMRILYNRPPGVPSEKQLSLF